MTRQPETESRQRSTLETGDRALLDAIRQLIQMAEKTDQKDLVSFLEMAARYVESDFGSFTRALDPNSPVDRGSPRNLGFRTPVGFEDFVKRIRKLIPAGRSVVSLQAGIEALIDSECRDWPAPEQALLRQNVKVALGATTQGQSLEPLFVKVGQDITKPAKPQWRERSNYPDLKGLTAPQFLRRVYSEELKRKGIRKEIIRASDPTLMDAVETYISQRKRRELDLGDAAGMKFISKPAGNRISREEAWRNPASQIEHLRERDRRAARARRVRRAKPAPK